MQPLASEPQVRFVPSPSVVARPIAADTVLLDLASGIYFSVNAVGAFIWDRISAGKSLGDIVEAVTETFEVSPAVAGLDADSFFQTLLERGLIAPA